MADDLNKYVNIIQGKVGRPYLRTAEVCKVFDTSRVTLFGLETQGSIQLVTRDWRVWRRYESPDIVRIEAALGVAPDWTRI